jgi:hypothetical protein
MRAAVVTLPAYEKQAKRWLTPPEREALEDHIVQ